MNFFCKYLNLFLCFIAFSSFSQNTNLFSSKHLENTFLVKIKKEYFNYFNNLKNTNKIIPYTNGEIKKIFSYTEKNNNQLSLYYVIKFYKPVNEKTSYDLLKKQKFFQKVEPYFIPELCYFPNDTYITNQYYLYLINIFTAWDLSQGNDSIVIGIVDTGIDTGHIDLKANFFYNIKDTIDGLDNDKDGYIDNYLGWDLGMNDNNPQSVSTHHGVHVSGIVAAVTDNLNGIAGIGFNSKILPVKITDDNTGELIAAYQGIVYAADHGAKIINCSWGSTYFSSFGKDVVDYAVSKGALIVAAAGNNNSEVKFYPAAYDNVLSVGATKNNDEKWEFSNYGYYVDIMSPGVNIYSTWNGGTYMYNSGTSMATAIVSGAAAIIKSFLPYYNMQQISALIKVTADDIYPKNSPLLQDKLGNGKINVSNALLNYNKVKYIELSSATISDTKFNNIQEGDTAYVTINITNMLEPVQNVTANLTSLSSKVNVLSGNFTFGNMNTLESKNNSLNPFVITLLPLFNNNEKVLFKLNIKSNTLNENFYFSFDVNRDYININPNTISTTLTSNGRLGYNDGNNEQGIGFKYYNDNLLFEAGLMIGVDTTRVSNSIRGDTDNNNDFVSTKNITGLNSNYSDYAYQSSFNDSNAELPIKLECKQYTYAFSKAPYDKFIITIYNIKNNNTDTLKNIFLGIFTDWDIIDYSKNKAKYDSVNKLIYVYNTNTPVKYAAVQLLSNLPEKHYAIDNIPGGAGGINIYDVFSKKEKFIALSTNRDSAGQGSAGNDVASIISAGPFSIAPNQNISVAFSILADDSLKGLITSANKSKLLFDSLKLSVNTINNNKNLTNIFPNPFYDFINIHYNNYNNYILKIINLEGKIIFLKNYNSEKNKNYSINLSFIPKGIYILQISSHSEIFATKIVKL